DPGLRLGLVAMKYARSEQLVDRLVAHQADIRLLLASERGRETWFVLLRHFSEAEVLGVADGNARISLAR
ncbi:hypothetical protein, partial [Haliangium sp.]